MSNKQIDVTTKLDVSPQLLAQMFWQLASDEQADFYEALDFIAGDKLCLQTAYIMEELASRHAAGNRSACNAFRTLHAHADGYGEVLPDVMAREAKRAIRGYVATQGPTP